MPDEVDSGHTEARLAIGKTDYLDIDGRQLRFLLTTHESGSLTQAAQRLEQQGRNDLAFFHTTVSVADGIMQKALLRTRWLFLFATLRS